MGRGTDQERGLTRSIGSVLARPSVTGRPVPGSYWERWTAGWPHFAAFRSARAALRALLVDHSPQRVWLPAYICASLADAVPSDIRRWYDLSDALAPDVEALAQDLRAGDAVIVVAFFGNPPPAALKRLARHRTDVLWIEDRAHQAGDADRWAQMVLYSPRKLIGVGDGGLLLSRTPATRPTLPAHPNGDGAQRRRALDPDGHHPREWSPLFQAQERAFTLDPEAMAAETLEVLAGTHLEADLEARRRNGRRLVTALHDLTLGLATPADIAWLAVPIRVENRDSLAEALAREGIFCARHWAELPSDPERYARLHQIASQILSLPCDPRYDDADMDRMIQTVRRLQARPAR